MRTLTYSRMTRCFMFLEKNLNELGQRMNADLVRIENWLNLNKLKVNVDKTKCMIIRKNNVRADVVIRLCGETIENVECIKYLGVVVDRKLTLNDNVLFVVKKVAKKINFFGRIAKNLTFAARVQVHKSIISPHFDYCATLLFSANREYIKKLQTLQNRALRVILKCNRYTRSTKMLEALQLMNVSQRIRMVTLRMVYKIKHGLVPEYLAARITETFMVIIFVMVTISDCHGFNNQRHRGC